MINQGAGQNIIISPDNDVKQQLDSYISSNVLCNYMREPEYLKMAIKTMSLRPRYFEEDMQYLQVDGLTYLTFPMLCFCDIPFAKASHHMSDYGHYGIALKKQYCIEKGVQPINYLNAKSFLTKDLVCTLRKLYALPEIKDKKLEFLPNYLERLILYSKPIVGQMRRDNEEPKIRLFKDESEWRYIPDIPSRSKLPIFLDDDDNNAEGRNKFSDALNKFRSTNFHFGINDVAYIIVSSEQEATDFSDYISSLRRFNRTERNKLISKIEISENFSKDLI